MRSRFDDFRAGIAATTLASMLVSLVGSVGERSEASTFTWTDLGFGLLITAVIIWCSIQLYKYTKNLH